MKMTDIMKKSHSESKSENLDAILQKIDNKAFITNSADSAHTETKPQPIKLRRKSIGIAAAAACAAIAVGAFAFSGLLKPDIDATTPVPSTASTDTTTRPLKATGDLKATCESAVAALVVRILSVAPPQAWKATLGQVALFLTLPVA
jgi:hypothetical protein